MLAINSSVDQILNNKIEFASARFPEVVGVRPANYVLIKAGSDTNHGDAHNDSDSSSSGSSSSDVGEDADGPDNEDSTSTATSPEKSPAEFYDVNENKNDRGSSKDSRILKSWLPSDRSPIGLQNHSVTCYMNAAMQALFHIPAVAHYLRDVAAGKYKSTVSPKSVTVELASLYERLCTSGKKGAIYPSKMIRRLQDINFVMSPMEQEDSHEYYMSLIGRLQEDSVPKGQKLRSSIMHDIFGGNLNQQVTCKTCGHVSTTNQDFYDIPVSFTKKIKKYGGDLYRLEDSITDFFSPELITVDKRQKSGYTCEKCKNLTSAVKINHIAEAPEYLTIHFKRFKFQGSVSQKIKEPMLYPKELDLTRYSMDKNGEPFKYRLIAIIAHAGRTASSGHYVALCRQPDNTWAEYDDELVSGIRKESQLQDDNAYMLIYTRLSVKATKPVEQIKGSARNSRKRSHASNDNKPSLDDIDDIFAKKSKTA